MLARLFLVALLPWLTFTLPTIDTAAYPASDIIRRDVCIIGGGSSGTYGAVRLRDQGKSIVVVEAEDRLGGHTETYTDPGTEKTVDYGVVLYHNIDLVKNYFGRFDIALTLTNPVAQATLPGQSTCYVDYRTGEVMDQYTPEDVSVVLQMYGSQVAKYPYLEAGFDLPDPVPADLLLSFEDFAKKYSLENLIGFMFNFAQGVGDLLTKPALYILKYVGPSVLDGTRNGFLATTKQDNSELYVKAQAELEKDILLNSRVIATDRFGDGAKVLVETPNGIQLILAKKVLLTVPPLLSSLAGFDLDASEKELFAQFLSNGYWTGLIRNIGIPNNLTVQNIGANTPYNLPVLPGLYGVSPTVVPGLHDFKYGSPCNIPDDQVQSNIVADIHRLRTAGTLNTTSPEFAAFSSHTPFELTVPSDAIKAGFYRKLYALQGQRNTWYTGAAFHYHDSTALWQFTEALLPNITVSL